MNANVSEMGHTYYNLPTLLEKAYKDSSKKTDAMKSGLLNREVYVIIPNRDENPLAVYQTIINAGRTNIKAKNMGIDYRIKGIILSDQSTELSSENRDNLSTAKDWLIEEYDGMGMKPPSIYHLDVGEETDEIMMDFAGKYFGDVIGDHPEPRGKGWNLLVSSLSTEKGPDWNKVLLYIDSENLLVNAKHFIGLGWPMYSKLSDVKFTKSTFDRYHMEGGKKKLGGRVNHTVFRPLVRMLHKAGMMPDIRYPLSGEIGIRRDFLFRQPMPMRYSVEMATNLTSLKKGSPLALQPRKEFVEVDLGHNNDQAHGEGKSRQQILKGLGNMARQILPVTLDMIGPDFFTQNWESADQFMDDFSRFQEYHVRKWVRGLGKDREANITGGIDQDELQEFSSRFVERGVKRLFEEKVNDESFFENLNKDFKLDYGLNDLESDKDKIMTPLHQVRKEIGYSRFDELIETMSDKRETILD